MDTVARGLARYIEGLSYENVPEDVVTLAKGRILDAIGACIAGKELPWSKMALAVVQDSLGEATIIGQNRGYAVRDAAFVGGVMAHSVMQEDSQKVGGHPSTTVVPAGLTVAEEHRSSGKELLLSIVIGYELMNRITAGDSRGSWQRRSFGRVSQQHGIRNLRRHRCSGKTRETFPEQLIHAIGYTANLAGGLTAGFAAGTMEHMFQAGLAAQNAITAVRIAQSGATASELTLESKHGFYASYCGSTERIQRVTAELGNSFAIRDVWSKFYPAAGFNQESIALGQELAAKYKIGPSDIQKVVERSSPKKKGYAGADTMPPYRNVIQALLSGQFCLAAAILGKPVGSYRFFYDHYGDQEVAEFAKKIEIVGEGDRKVTRIEIYLQDGTQFSIEEEASKILLSTLDNMETKFRKLTAEAFRRTGQRRSSIW